MEILSGIAPFISEAQEIGLLPSFSFMYIGKLLLRFGFRWIKKLSFLALSFSWLTLKDLLNFGLVILSIVLLVITVSFIKSLQPRYDFQRKLDSPQAETPVDKPPKTVRSPLEDFEQRPPSKSLFQRISLVTRLNEEHEKLAETCGRSLANKDIKSVYQYLSWSQTRVDLEGVSWLNQTLSTLWPTIKSIVNNLVLKGLLKPKDNRPKSVSKKLNKKKTNLGLYLSCRRKLDLLHKSRFELVNDQEDEFFHRSAINLLVFFIRLVSIYLKQFINDLFVNSILNAIGAKKEAASKSREISLKQMAAKISPIHSKSKSWSSCDTKRKTKSKSKPKSKLTPKSAPQATRTKIIAINTSKLMRYSPRARRFQMNRKKLASLMRKFDEKAKPKEMVIEKLRLGNTIPKVNGIKLIEENSNLMSDSGETLPYKLVGDDSRIRLMSEISYESDRRFRIRLDSIPVFGCISLVKFAFQLRFLVTLNHTTTELNQDLKVFETPDDVLFPAINYVQVTLLDTPRIDWQLESGTSCAIKQIGQKTIPAPNRLSGMKKVILGRIKRILDPVRIVNHNYFKYIVHSLVYFTLRWFQPFDIKIGDNIYIKTVP